MKKKLFRDISYNTLQVLVNQFLGVVIFLLISRALDKPVFGEFCWSLAVLTFASTLLTLRLEQVIVRDVAAGADPSRMLMLFMAHNLVLGSGVFLLLSLGYYLFPNFLTRHSLFWFLAASQLLTFLALPFRQIVTGRAAFGKLAILSTVSNLIRALSLLWLTIFSQITITAVLVIFLISAMAEFLAGSYIVFLKLHLRFPVRISFPDYRKLISSSLPQVGMALLNAGIARMDLILMGIFSTPSHTAEYGFAYKAFELSPIPLLIIAPFLLNRFSRDKTVDPEWLDRLIRAEMICATLLPLLFTIAWAPLADSWTHNKYGQVNIPSFLILSCSIPFQYLINIIWSYEFAGNRLGRIFRVTAISAAVIVAGDLVLIPILGGPGAAIAFLAGMILQFLLFYGLSPGAPSSGTTPLKVDWIKHLLVPIAIAVCSGIPVIWLTDALVPRLLIASCSYVLLTWATGQVSKKDWVFQIARKVDLPLLAFLVLFLNVKLPVKIVAILLALWWNRKGKTLREALREGWIRFYGIMILLAIAGRLITGEGVSSMPAILSLGLGCCYWGLAFIAAWQILSFVRGGEPGRLHRTIELFFILHVSVMLVSFLVLCWRLGTINPYTFEGFQRKYFINTGDFIRGIGMDGSVSNAMISAFGLLYFLYRGRILLSVLCMVAVLLAGSNFTDLLLAGCLLFIFFCRTNRIQKSVIVVHCLLIILYYARVSPQNATYVDELFKKLTKQEMVISRADARPVASPGNTSRSAEEAARSPDKDTAWLVPGTASFIHPEMKERLGELSAFQHYYYSSPLQDSLNRNFARGSRSGRKIAWQELVDFFREHPGKLLTGAGMGNFSSRLAFKTTGLGIYGAWPERYRYVHPDFRDHYLYLYLYYHMQDPTAHSTTNQPDSVYGQLLSEYGLVGLLVFCIFYAGFFLKRIRSLSYGLPLLLLMTAAFGMDYWFEQLSIVILFELLLFINNQDMPKKPTPEDRET